MAHSRKEIERDIEAVEKNIEHMEKDLQNPKYTEEQKNNLRSDIEYQRERLAELEGQLGQAED